MIFFHKLGVKYFFDQNFALNIALQEAQKEFISKLTEHDSGKKIFPLFCSECPGWVCYAEKILKEEIIEKMSKVKSPQQVMGNIIKDVFSDIIEHKKEEIYHMSIQPCYDKKLEATRPEFERNLPLKSC